MTSFGYIIGLLPSVTHVVTVLGTVMAPPTQAGAPAGFNQIITAVNSVRAGVFNLASAVAILMIIVAGLSIMFDRDASTEKRGQKLSFLRTVLIGYAIVFAANFLITLLTQIVPQN